MGEVQSDEKHLPPLPPLLLCIISPDSVNAYPNFYLFHNISDFLFPPYL